MADEVVATKSSQTFWERWYTHVVAGIFLFFWAGHLHGTLTELERSGGTVKVHEIEAFLYQMFGKDGAVSILALIGISWAIYGFLRLARGVVRRLRPA